MTALDTPASAALDPRLYVDPEVAAREQEAIFARSWQLAGHVARPRRARPLPDRAGRRRVGARRARRGRRAARLPQRLPPPRHPAARGPRRLRQGDPLPLPRLDLPHRRHADRRAGGPRLRRPRQGRTSPLLPARVDDASPASCSSTLDPDARAAAPSALRRAGGAARALRARAPRALHRVALSASRRTGRSSPTTTSRATTSRSRTRA